MKRYFILLPLFLFSCSSIYDNDLLIEISEKNKDTYVLHSLPNGTEIVIKGKVQKFRSKKTSGLKFYIQFEDIKIPIDGNVIRDIIPQEVDEYAIIKGIVKERLYAPRGNPAVSANQAMQPKASSKYIGVYYYKELEK